MGRGMSAARQRGFGLCYVQGYDCKGVFRVSSRARFYSESNASTAFLPSSSHFPDLFVTEISSFPDSHVIVPLMGPHRSLPCDGK